MGVGFWGGRYRDGVHVVLAFAFAFELMSELGEKSVFLECWMGTSSNSSFRSESEAGSGSVIFGFGT